MYQAKRILTTGLLGVFFLTAVSLAGWAQDLTWEDSDANGDGSVDHKDVFALQNVWLESGTHSNPDSLWTLLGDDVYRAVGNVGIGLTNPAVKLDVEGSIRSKGTSGSEAAQLRSDADGGIVESLNAAGAAASRVWVDEYGSGLVTLNDPAGNRLTSVGSDGYGGFVIVENNLGAAVANVWVNSSSEGLISLNDGEGFPRLNLFSDAIGGIVEIDNFADQSAGRFWVTDQGAGQVTLNNPEGDLRAVLSILSTGSGDLRLDGPNGNANISLAAVAGSENRGVISVHNSDGEPRAQMFVDSEGNGFVGPVTAKGTAAAGLGVDAAGRGMIWAGQSYAVEDHPTQPDSKIVYSSLEGPEAAIYCRGSVQLESGLAEIELPEDFTALAELGSLTVQLTPGSLQSKGVAFESLGKGRIRIGELQNGTGSYPVHYTVFARRKGYEDYQTVMSNEQFNRVFQKDRRVAATEKTTTRSSAVKKAPRISTKR